MRMWFHVVSSFLLARTTSAIGVAVCTFSPIGSPSSNDLRVCVCACLCVYTGIVWNELICWYASIMHTSSLFHQHACTHAHTFSYHLTGLKMNIAIGAMTLTVLQFRYIYMYVMDTCPEKYASNWSYYKFVLYLPVSKQLLARTEIPAGPVPMARVSLGILPVPMVLQYFSHSPSPPPPPNPHQNKSGILYHGMFVCLCMYVCMPLSLVWVDWAFAHLALA